MAGLSGGIIACLYPAMKYKLQNLKEIILTGTSGVASVSGEINKQLKVLLKLITPDGSQLTSSGLLGCRIFTRSFHGYNSISLLRFCPAHSLSSSDLDYIYFSQKSNFAHLNNGNRDTLAVL